MSPMGTFALSRAERMELSQRTATRAECADDASFARWSLLLVAGETWARIRDKLACNDAFIDHWRKRLDVERHAGLLNRRAGRRPVR